MPNIEIEIPDRLWQKIEAEAEREGMSVDVLMEKVLHLHYVPLANQTGGGKTITGVTRATLRD